MLLSKKCTECNASFLTFSKTPYCCKCIKNECCMSHLRDSNNRYNCNCTFDLVSINNKKYCLGHFKTLQNKCAVCGISRPENCTNFQHDYMWYCPIHSFEYKKKYTSVIYETLKNILCTDLIIEILRKAIQKVDFRYPEEFNIPLRKSLK